MEKILYNSMDKEAAIILGYGIGNHLSLKYLQDIIYYIRTLFPQLRGKDLNNLKFLEVAQSSRSHRYMWYTRFNYELPVTEGNFTQGDVKGYAFGDYIPKQGDIIKREAETAQSIMNRLIHD